MVLDQVAPFVDLTIDVERCLPCGHLRHDDLGAAPMQLGDDPVRVESLVGDEARELDVLDQWSDTDRVVSLAGQQDEADEIAQGVGHRQDFGRQSATRLADRLALSPPFAPWPWRWTRTMVASTMAYSMSGWSETASNMRLNT